MSTEEMEEFLKGPNLARVAVVRGDGSPFIVPVWYEWDGKYLYVVGRKRSSWVDDVRRDGRVCVLIDEDKLPLRKVIIEGTAEVVGTDWIEIGKRMAVRYFGPDVGPKYLEGTLDQPRWVIRITPKKNNNLENTSRVCGWKRSLAPEILRAWNKMVYGIPKGKAEGIASPSLYKNLGPSADSVQISIFAHLPVLAA
jgi:PPOX class probable F420-dependent enzyme